jgi:hypothetical protein
VPGPATADRFGPPLAVASRCYGHGEIFVDSTEQIVTRVVSQFLHLQSAANKFFFQRANPPIAGTQKRWVHFTRSLSARASASCLSQIRVSSGDGSLTASLSVRPRSRVSHVLLESPFLFVAACAAASLATDTRNGEHDT